MWRGPPWSGCKELEAGKNAPRACRVDLPGDRQDRRESGTTRSDGQPGGILRDRGGKVVGTLTLDMLGGQIQTIRAVVNPNKLGHLGPAADAWAKVKQARRLND